MQKAGGFPHRRLEMSADTENASSSSRGLGGVAVLTSETGEHVHATCIP